MDNLSEYYKTWIPSLYLKETLNVLFERIERIFALKCLFQKLSRFPFKNIANMNDINLMEQI